MQRARAADGQTSVEWLGAMALVIALVGLVVAAVPGVADTIGDVAARIIEGLGG